jgi:H+/Cl- antiporter ClcA
MRAPLAGSLPAGDRLEQLALRDDFTLGRFVLQRPVAHTLPASAIDYLDTYWRVLVIGIVAGTLGSFAFWRESKFRRHHSEESLNGGARLSATVEGVDSGVG